MQRMTLVELMIVVAIIAILGAIAIPNFHEAQMRARYTEITTLTPQGLELVSAYYEANDLDPAIGPGIEVSPGVFDNSATCPRNTSTPNRQRRPWKPCEDPEDEAYMAIIGMEPDGEIYGLYSIYVTTWSDTQCPGTQTGDEIMLTAHARHNLDGDGDEGIYVCCPGGTGTLFDVEAKGMWDVHRSASIGDRREGQRPASVISSVASG